MGQHVCVVEIMFIAVAALLHSFYLDDTKLRCEVAISLH